MRKDNFIVSCIHRSIPTSSISSLFLCHTHTRFLFNPLRIHFCFFNSKTKYYGTERRYIKLVASFITLQPIYFYYQKHTERIAGKSSSGCWRDEKKSGTTVITISIFFGSLSLLSHSLFLTHTHTRTVVAPSFASQPPPTNEQKPICFVFFCLLYPQLFHVLPLILIIHALILQLIGPKEKKGQTHFLFCFQVMIYLFIYHHFFFFH